MDDREKVIKGLEETEIMLTQAVDRGGEMAVMGAFKCLNRITDALALLKEQEAMKPIYNEQKYGDHLPHCGNCEKVLPNNGVYGKVNFCHYCGQAVKRMSEEKVVNIDEYIPHKVSETICVKCGHRQIDVRPEGTLLKDLECPQCGETGFIIETGEDISDERQ